MTKALHVSDIRLHSLCFILTFLNFAAPAQQKDRVTAVIQAKAVPYPLQYTRLLESPFKNAMQKDGDWLLSLKPDRLLSRFRLNAGLQPKDSIYGGWERMGVSGHSLGHYLTACSMMYAASGDQRFKQKTDYIINELAECQEARKTGYVGGIPNEDKIFDQVASGDIRSQGFDLNGGWVPWYTQHKVFEGMIDAFYYTANEQAKQVAVKFADWIDTKFSKLSETQFQKMLDCEHGGMNESLANLYAITGDKKYLALSYRFNHKKILDPLSQAQDILPGKHANTQIPKIIGASRQYELTGSENEKNSSNFFWQQVVNHHSYVIGGNSDHEHFGEADKLSARLSTNTTETCNSYNMLKLTRHLFSLNPSAALMDYYERTLYNHILASINPDNGMTCYYVPLVSGAQKTYGTAEESFWCCTGTGMENHVKYGESIYYAGNDKSLYVNLFIPSVLDVPQGISVKIETAYPEKQNINLTILRAEAAAFSIRVRHPAWAVKGTTVKINGKSISVDGKPGSYITLKKQWKAGDIISLDFPMSLYSESMVDNPSRIALLYGPLVLSGALGKEQMPAVDIPVFVGKNADINKWVETSKNNNLSFLAFAENKNKNVSLVPFYRMHHQRHAVYWDVFTNEQWKQKKQEYEIELQRIEELKKRTVDEMRIGEMQPERDHNLQGKNTETGEAFGRKWRHASNGGWFSFDMAVSDNSPLQLLCTYWGSDRGREFEIWIDGEKIATQKLSGEKPNEFMDIYYTIPSPLVKGKSKINIRFQAIPSSTAGGLFGCRIIK
ncbi:MAG: glycoside hydrolase family 127 protein [Chitinophagaceae bacterium]|nr:glycoside hydrolase family 127 protein [Chitinophagaceae bacterium]